MLKKLRKKYNLKQAELANLLGGVNRSYIALIETDRQKMPAWVAIKLKEIFGDQFVASLNL